MRNFENYWNSVEQRLMLESVIDRYKPMFNDLPEHDRSEAEARIGRLFQMFPPRDDIRQYLTRLVKYQAIDRLPVDKLTDSQKSYLKDYSNRVKQSRFGGNIDELPANFSPILSHLLSLPIKEIQDFRFSYEHPQTLIDYFQELENKYKRENENSSEWIDVTEELKSGDIIPVIIFQGGKQGWFKLNRSSCTAEGKAMGHCGNTASYDRTERILSFRTVKKIGNKIFHRPSLTFILHRDGDLGEMKGRANNKPDPKYHDVILALLKHKDTDGRYLIGGVNGGGYKPEANFSLTDLPIAKLKELLEIRPDLLNKKTELVLNGGVITEELLKKYDKDWDKVRIYETLVEVDTRTNLFDYLETDAPQRLRDFWEYSQDYYPDISENEVSDFIKNNSDKLVEKGYDLSGHQVLDDVTAAITDAYRNAHESASIKEVIRHIERDPVEVDLDIDSDDNSLIIRPTIAVDESKYNITVQFTKKEFNKFWSYEPIKEAFGYPELIEDIGRRFGEIEPYVSEADIWESLNNL